MSRRRRPGGQSQAADRSTPPRKPQPQSQPPAGRSSPRPQKAARPKRSSPADFWGRSGDGQPAVEQIRPTPDPAALPRSLGDPPLGSNPTVAAHHLAAVYEEAVRAATALAAANGLIDLDAG